METSIPQQQHTLAFNPSLTAISAYDLKLDSKSLNDTIANLSIQERLQLILSRFSEQTVVLSSAGIGSRVLPQIISDLSVKADLRLASQIKKLPIILIDTGALFEETIRYAQQLKTETGLNFLRVAHNLSRDEFLKLSTELIKSGNGADEAFDKIAKVHVLGNLLKNPKSLNLKNVDIVISGNRRADSPSRADLQFVEEKNGRLFIYPIADLTDSEVEDFFKVRELADHPLKDQGYLSVGNTHDSRPAEPNDKFVKAGRHTADRTECGLHIQWALQEIEIRLIKDWNVIVRSPGLEELKQAA